MVLVRAGEAGQDAAQTAPPLDLPFTFDGPPPPVPPEVISRDAASGRVTIRAVRLTAPLRIDGQLDEAVYTSVRSMSDFIQQDPQEGSAATEKTEVWLFFDRDQVYVSFRCWESYPERLVASEMRRDARNLDPPRGQLYHEQDREPREPATRPLHRKEIRGGENVPVRFQELLPRRPLLTLWGRLDPVLPEDVGDGPAPDAVIQIRERALNPRVAPVAVLGRHPHHQLPNLRHDRRPSRPAPLVAVVLPGGSRSRRAAADGSSRPSPQAEIARMRQRRHHASVSEAQTRVACRLRLDERGSFGRDRRV